MNNLRQIGLAMIQYAIDHDDQYPGLVDPVTGEEIPAVDATGRYVGKPGDAQAAFQMLMLEHLDHLSETAAKVYAIPGGKGYSEDFPELTRIGENPKVEFKTGADVKEIGGSDFVEYVTLDGAVQERLSLDGVFIILEHVPTAGILREAGISTDDGGCVIVDGDVETNIEGVFAAGDCTCEGMQIVTAAGMGAKAALSAMKHVKSLR